MKPALTRKQLKTAFHAFHAWAQQQQVELVVVYGTLLGFVRQQHFIEGDDDIDFAVDRANMRRLLQSWRGNTGPVRLMTVKTNGSVPVFLQFQHDNGALIDVYMMQPFKDDKIAVAPEPVIYPSSIMYPVKRALWHGLPINVPAQPDAFLQQTYGADWRIPRAKSTYRWTDIKQVPILADL